MTAFDEIAENAGDNEVRAWLSKVIDAKEDIVTFVAAQRPGTSTAEFDKYLKGSFNLSLVVKFSDGRRSLIRFPKPGHTGIALQEEKVTNEVHLLKYLAEKTTIPVPRVLSWGLTKDSPNLLGPFIIMEFIEGTSLSTILKQPTNSDQDEVVLAKDFDEKKLDYVYEQLADYMLQLSELDFSKIGAITRSPISNEWMVSKRPLTYNMNELLTVVSDYPTDGLPKEPFSSASEFFHSLADEHLVHLKIQRNLAGSREDARKRYIARHRFKQLIAQFCTHDNDGPFKPYCEDMQPSNMLADPETLQITALLDFEFTNAMPSQFSYDRPWWLLLLGPDMWLDRYSYGEFMDRYVPRLEQFLRALERVESVKHVDQTKTRLSCRMRESWANGRFWFDYEIRKGFDIDAVYWAALHKDGDDKLSEEMNEEMDRSIKLKMEQLKAYDAECEVRFP